MRTGQSLSVKETGVIIRRHPPPSPPPSTPDYELYDDSFPTRLVTPLQRQSRLPPPPMLPLLRPQTPEIYDDTRIEEDDDYGYELYEEPYLCPPVPPRVPINGKRKVPDPIWANDDSEQFVKDQTVLREKVRHRQEDDRNNNTLQIGIYETFGDTGIQAMTGPGVHSASETERNVELENVRRIDTSKFHDLVEDLAKMKIENSDLHFEITLLEEKSTLHGEANTGLRKRRELKEAIVLKEKERIALQSGRTI